MVPHILPSRSKRGINIAVATDTEAVKVDRRENGGRELSHVWIVKDFDVRQLTSDKGVIEIDPAIVSSGHIGIRNTAA